MSKRFRVTLDGVTAGGVLHEDKAKATVARLWQALPIEDTLRHVRWSGEAGYLLATHLADHGMALENAVSFYAPGTVAFRPEHGEVAFSYGQAQARDHMQPAGRASWVATLDTNVEPFLARVAATRTEGGKPIRIEREG